jgi:hypothetical protein
MDDEHMTVFERRTLIAILLVALAIRLSVAWAPVEWLLRGTLADDPFYYFTIARHFVQGHGFSFDGVEPTNGFHPFWMLVILPLFGAVRDPILVLHFVLTVSAVLDTLALLLLFRLLRELRLSTPVSVGVAVLYAISPLSVSTSGPLNGLETALNLAVTVAFLTSYRRAFVGPDHTLAATVRLGCCAGFLLLARTDNVVLLVLTYASLLWHQRTAQARLRRTLWSIVVGGFIAAPWFIWSVVRFGSLVQVSGRSVALFNRRSATSQGWTLLDYGVKQLRNLATIVTYFPVYHVNLRSFARASAGNLIIVTVLGCTAVHIYRKDSRTGQTALLNRLAPWYLPLAACPLFVLIHTMRAIELRGWYYVSMLPTLYVLLAIFADYATAAIPVGLLRGSRCLLTAGFGLLCFLTSVVSMRAGLSRRCGEIDSYRMIRTVNGTLPDGALLGSWNAGLFGYLYERGAVVNLDGLANNRVYDQIVGRSVGSYVSARRIKYLLDAPQAMEMWKPYWDHPGDAFVDVVMDNAVTAECREIQLVRVPQSRSEATMEPAIETARLAQSPLVR